METAKNVCLAGVKSVTIHDPTLASRADQNGNFYIDRAIDCDASGLLLPHTSRAELTAPRLRALNPNVVVSATWEAVTDNAAREALVAGHDVLIVTDIPHSEAIAFNRCCRAANVKFVAAEVTDAHC